MVWLGIQVLLLSAAVSWLLTPLVVKLGRKWGAVDLPGPRKIHTEPIPRVGGISVFVAFLIGSGYAAFASGFLPVGLEAKGFYWGSVAVAVSAVFLMGLVDDVRGLSFGWKFAVQIAAGVLVWLSGFRIESVSVPMGFGEIDLGGFSVVATVVWIVGVTNAMNLIDGLDGLAAGTALISTIAVAVIALLREQVAVTAVSVALVGSLAGFLRYNFAPARIFLGDSGSMLLGFLLAVLSIHASQKGATAVAVLAPILVLGVPLLDTSLTVLRRLYRLGKGGVGTKNRLAYFAQHATVVFLPDRAHLHHRLLDMGLSHRAAVCTLYFGALTTALCALSLVVTRSPALALLLLIILGTLLAAFLAIAALARVPEGSRPAASSKALSPRTWFPPSWKPGLRDSTVTPPE